MVAIPIVMADLGTLDKPIKSLAASVLVILSKCTNLVVHLTEDPGSLNPM